jgi:hypothetical protein
MIPVVLIFIAVIFALFIYILFMPITLRLNIMIDEKISIFSAVKIFPLEHRFVTGKPKKEKRTKEPKTTENVLAIAAEIPKTMPEKKFKLSRLTRTDLAVIFGVFAEALKLIGRLCKAPQYYLKANIAGGAEYPDVTGELYGAYHAIRPVLPNSISIVYNPDFAAEKFSGTVEVGLVIRIFRLIWETLFFIFRLPIIRLIKLYRKLKKGA